MKRFLWFNIDKIKNDSDYFLIVFMFLVLTQLSFYILPIKMEKEYKIYNLIPALVFSIFFLWTLFTKKSFNFKDVLNSFWKW